MFEILCVTGLGLILGSFANVCIHRLPLDQSVVAPRSRCPSCGTTLRWYENIPLASYLFLKGRCAHCGEPISWRYPAVEALMGALFAFVCWRQGDVPGVLLLGLILTFSLFVISVIDFQWQIIPDELSLGLTAAALLLSPANAALGETVAQRVAQSVLGGALGFFLLWGVAVLGRWAWKKDALGGGDVKLMAGVGAMLGWQGLFSTMLLGSLFGTLWSVTLMAARRMRWGSYLPFGPFLALGAWISWLSLEWIHRFLFF